MYTKLEKIQKAILSILSIAIAAVRSLVNIPIHLPGTQIRAIDDPYEIVSGVRAYNTPLYHCNVYTRDEGDNPRGKLCFRYEAGDIYPVEVIVNLLFCVWEHPNARGPANKGAANLYINNRTEHDRIALEWAKEHATECS